MIRFLNDFLHDIITVLKLNNLNRHKDLNNIVNLYQTPSRPALNWGVFKSNAPHQMFGRRLVVQLNY